LAQSVGDGGFSSFAGMEAAENEQFHLSPPPQRAGADRIAAVASAARSDRDCSEGDRTALTG
jgi:hypothetical protein